MYKKIESVEEFEKFFSMFTRKKILLLLQMKNWISMQDLVVRASLSLSDLNEEVGLLVEQDLVMVRHRRYGGDGVKEYKMNGVMIVHFYDMLP